MYGNEKMGTEEISLPTGWEDKEDNGRDEST
jgi:hypothetical protein